MNAVVLTLASILTLILVLWVALFIVMRGRRKRAASGLLRPLKRGETLASAADLVDRWQSPEGRKP